VNGKEKVENFLINLTRITCISLRLIMNYFSFMRVRRVFQSRTERIFVTRKRASRGTTSSVSFLAHVNPAIVLVNTVEHEKFLFRRVCFTIDFSLVPLRTNNPDVIVDAVCCTDTEELIWNPNVIEIGMFLVL
jgi:hypothetical protein